MRLSLYTFVKNGLRGDFHLLAMLKHHLPLADEIVVHEGMSTDGSYEAIANLDPKVKVFRSDWDAHKGMDYAVRFKDAARQRCTGDWCILLDCDEFIAEWDFDALRRRLEAATEDLFPVELLNFYGNYKVYNSEPERFRWPKRKVIVHRNRPDVEVYGDASSVRIAGQEAAWDAPSLLTIHHFGFVRKGARLREKWRNMRGRLYLARAPKFLIPSFVFDLFPHKWTDPDYLPYLRTYDGPFIKAVTDDPDEFVRDRFKLYKHLTARGAK